MNRLSRQERAQIIRCLVEGNSIRATGRLTGFAKNTIVKLLVELGMACSDYQDKAFTNLSCKTLQVDEIWAFVYAKNPNVPNDKHGQFGYGDVWTFTAIEADTKLVPTWMLGERSPEHAREFMDDLAARLAHRVQLTTDGHKMYLHAVPDSFADEIDYAMFVKIYGTVPPRDGWERGKWERTTGSRVVIGSQQKIVSGSPDPDKINTAFIERQNLTMRMGMRRFTRATNGFSKKVENLAAAIALHYMHYNFARPHKTLANPYQRTPAMAAGIADHVWTCEEIAALLD